MDFCIVGSGIAGMSLALRLSKIGSVCILSKGDLLSGSTPLAQGGIAAVTDFEHDSFESHIQDTLKAGGYTNNREAVKILVENAPQVIDDLHRWGVKFFQEKHLEGGHSYARIFHASDESGKQIAEALSKQIKNTPNIHFYANTVAYAIDIDKRNIITYDFTDKTSKQFSSNIFIFASGGYSSLFASSTSPVGNIGSGIHVLQKAGAKLKNMASVQFHPTVLKKQRFPRLLLTEAIRGVGAQIVDTQGLSIIDPLLPRDKVSKAVFNAEEDGKNVFLDARMIRDFSSQFPFLYKQLTQKFQIDPSKDLLPITYGAHYCMGGIETDLWGKTNLPGVYAIGECAFTRVHGNNRLASNSLLEGLVFGLRAYQDICSTLPKKYIKYTYNYNQNIPRFIPSDSNELFFEIQNLLSTSASIERSKKKAEEALYILEQKNVESTRDIIIQDIAREILKDIIYGVE